MATIPELKAGLNRYVLEGIPTGHFLHAVLSGDLYEAVARADSESGRNLVEITKFIYNHMPMASFGNAVKVEKWLYSKEAETMRKDQRETIEKLFEKGE